MQKIKEIEADWFETKHLKSNLKSRSIKGGSYTVGAQGISFILSTGSTFILARLLTPGDFGLVAMVTAVTGFVTIFKDLGLSAAVIQKENLAQPQVSALFWINILISLGIALAVALIAPLLVQFYGEDRLYPITLVFAVSIFLSGFSLQHSALMKRQMQFKTLSFIQILSSIIGILISIFLAWKGFGYWALVATAVTPSIIFTVSVWTVCNWRPDFPKKAQGVKSFLKFGAGLTGFDLINYFSRNMDNVLIGKFVGTAALGLYFKAYQLLMLPITQLRNPLNSVALPALSSLQKDHPKYSNFYSRYLFILAFFSMPIIVYLTVFAEELILVVLGDQWLEAGILFQLLAIAGFVQPVLSTCGLILITTGKARRYFNVGLVNAIFMISGFVIGVYLDGVKGVAISQVIVVYLLFFPILFYSLKHTPVSVNTFLRSISSPLIFSLASGAGMFVYTKYIPPLDQGLPILYCLVGFVVGAIIYVSLMNIFPKSRERFMHVLDMRSFFKKKKTV